MLGAFVGLGFQVFEDWSYGVNASTAGLTFSYVRGNAYAL